MKLIKLLLLPCFTIVLSSAQSIPQIRGKALDSSEITLPGQGSKQPLILIVGFSQRSGTLCQAWSKKISSDYHADSRVAYFSLAILQGAPSLFRPLIVRGIRKGLPVEEHRHFVPIYTEENELKKFVNFSAPDDAYLIVATADGHPVWQAHGAYSDSLYSELKKSVSALLDGSAIPKP